MDISNAFLKVSELRFVPLNATGLMSLAAQPGCVMFPCVAQSHISSLSIFRIADDTLM
jgi:hypothetical protein